MNTQIGATGGRPAHHARRPAFWRQVLAGTAIAMLAFCAFAGAASAQASSVGTLKAELSKTRPDTLVLKWNGTVGAPMAAQIKREFDRYRGQTRRVVLTIRSGGGNVAEGEKVIQVLRDIKRTHQLETAVAQGNICGSMCVFIYIQGDIRRGALTSTWLFHEISQTDPKTGNITKLDRVGWDRLISKYLEPAGVSKAWIASIKAEVTKSDIWRTGNDLVQAKSGIITKPLGNHIPRKI